MNEKDKLSWVKSLKPGDTVEDCRMNVVRIREVIPQRNVRFPYWLRKIIFADWMPFTVMTVFETAYYYISRKVNNTYITDVDLIMEDGSQCSALHCCDSPKDKNDDQNLSQ